MLGEFAINVLVLVMGYIYPAIRCFNSIEASKPNVAVLRFWCQYWVIISILTAIEKLGDMFISWLPLYGESKLAFIVYLWHPKTRGTSQVYHTLLRPFVMQHEKDIEKKMQQILMRSIDLLGFYFKHFVDKGQSLAFQVLDYVLSKPWKPPPSPIPLESSQEGRKKRASGKKLSFFWTRKGGGSPPFAASSTTTTQGIASANLDGDDMKTQMQKVEEALRAAGVNLRQN